MRNKFGGECYRCGGYCEPGAGHFERLAGAWRVQHAACAIEFRGQVDPARRDWRAAQDEQSARGTGRSAQRARRRIRERQNAKTSA